MAGKGGGAWKVAYADFVTAMMAFFLVMWIVAQNKDAKDAVSAYFRDPFGNANRPSGTGNKDGTELKLKDPRNVKTKGGAKVPTLRLIHDRYGTPVGSTVHFDENEAKLNDAGRRQLKELTPLVLGKQNKIEIRGHTARRPRSDAADPNDPWRTSFERCEATMQFLVAQGVDPARIRLTQAGPHEPMADGGDADWRTRNSRVEVIMLNEYVDDFAVTRRKIDPDEEPREEAGGSKPAADHGPSKDANTAADKHGGG